MKGISALVALAVFVAVVGFAALFGFASAAQADVPPITAFPPAGDAAPPADTIGDAGACSGWYRQSSYGGLWPTDSTWWEYSCSYMWPGWGTGATNANWWGQNTWTDYFCWDGSKPVFYGENFYDGYSDGWFMAANCSYWTDASSGWAGLIAATKEGNDDAPIREDCHEQENCRRVGGAAADPDRGELRIAAWE